MSNIIDLKSIIGKGYNRFWHFKGRYKAIKGGRGSKKSATTALWYIYNMQKYPLANTLVVRKRFNTHKDSTYSQLKWAARRLGTFHLWEFKINPLEAVYKPTGQKILFRGLDDPMSITSIGVDKGYLCWCWFEEAYQIVNEDDFDKVDMSIRGQLPDGYFKQITLTFNPWSAKHWLKTKFFDVKDEDTLALTTTYKCNEWLGEDDNKRFEKMRINKPRRYKVEGEGEWGIAEGTVYEGWIEQEFDHREIAKKTGYKSAFGLDFGYTNDPTAFICLLVNKQENKIYIFDEHYEHGMLNTDISTMITKKGYAKERIIADSAEPKSIEEIRRLGISRIKSAVKGGDSVRNGIQYINQFQIIVHPKCEKTIIELNNYIYEINKAGQKLNRPIDDFNHLMDAMRYAMEGIKDENKIEFA